MRKETSLIKYFNENIIYDSMTGHLFTIDKCAREVIQSEIQSQGNSPAIYRSKHKRQAIALLREKQASGILIDKPLSGYIVPKIVTVADVDIKEITFEVTEQCNLRCSYCYYDKSNLLTERRSHGANTLSIEIVDKALNYFLPLMNTNTTVGFYGGEAFLNIQMVEYILNRIRTLRPDWTGLTTLTSNFTIFDKEIEKIILQNKIILVLSIDGPKDIHNENRLTKSGSGTYELIMNNLKFFAQRNPTFCKEFVTTNTVLTSPDMFERLDDFFRKFPFSILSHRFSTVVIGSHYRTMLHKNYSTKDIQVAFDNWAVSQLASISNINEIVNSPLLLFYCKQMLRDFHNRSITDSSRKINFESCVPGHKVFVHTNGNLSVCEKCDSLIIGTVNSGLDLSTIGNIIDSWIFMLGDGCLSCPAISFCKACYLQGWINGAFSRPKLRRFCNYFILRTEKIFPIFLELIMRIPNFTTLMDEEFEIISD